MKKYTIFIVDDHEIFRGGMKSLINNEELGLVTGEAANGKQFLELLEKDTPDLILMDIAMPIMDGVTATKIALEKNPDLKILALTMFGDESYYYKMIDAGAKGFLLKTAGIDELELAINTMVEGKSFFSNEILITIINRISHNENNANQNIASKLSPREIEVLKLICKGLTNEKIAEQLFISPQTVKGHRSKLLEKTQSNNTASLVVYAIKNKIIQLDSLK